MLLHSQRLIEILLYGFMNFFPYLIMVLWPFEDQFRFSKKTTSLYIIVLTIIEIWTEYLSIVHLKSYSSLITLVNVIIFVISLFIFLKVHLGKLLFTLFMISNYANFIVVVSTFLSNVLFHSNTDCVGHFTTSIVMFVTQFVLLLPIGYHYKNFYIPTIKISHPRIWSYLWIVPLIFYVTWIYLIYFTGTPPYELALKFSTSLFLLFTTLGSWIIYHLIIKLICAEEDNLLKKDRIHMLELQAIQYKTLTKQMEKARIDRHDLRHHITVLDHLTENRDYQKLHDYLNKYKKSLSLDSQIFYCEHPSINLIINYYSQQAAQKDIPFNVSVKLPSSLSLPESTVNVLLGNILENAIEYCTPSSSGKKNITLLINYSKNVLAIFTSNTYSFDSSQESFSNNYQAGEDHGLGLISVQNIVNTYNGNYNSTFKDDIYATEITLLL